MDNNEIFDVIHKATEELKKCRDQINKLMLKLENVGLVRDAYHLKYPGISGQFDGKGVVYCAITGEYDDIVEPLFKSDNIDHILLTDRKAQDYSGAWEIRILDNEMKLSNQRLARWAKMHPFDIFPEYDWSLWIDGKFRIKSDIKDYISIYGKESGMLCFPHYRFRNISEEAYAIAVSGKADERELQKQIDAYKCSGYVEKGYIVETGVLLRNHHDVGLRNVMDTWWEELCTYDHSRDQMSFDYACWKNGYEYDLNDLAIYDNPWFESVFVHLRIILFDLSRYIDIKIGIGRKQNC